MKRHPEGTKKKEKRREHEMDSDLKEILKDIGKRVKTIEGILIGYAIITMLGLLGWLVVFLDALLSGG